MSYNEITNGDQLTNSDMYQIDKDLESKNIISIDEQLKYVEENYDAHYYLY